MYAAPMLIARSDMIATVMAGVVAASGHAAALRVLEPPLALDPISFILRGIAATMSTPRSAGCANPSPG